jgi:DNA-binding response OmpR family regulator
MRILYLEDEEQTCQAVGRYFEARGHQLDYAHDARSALGLVRRNPYSVALVDLRLGGGYEPQGLEFIADARKIDRDLPLVVLTASDQAETEAQARALGAAEFLHKPIALGVLEELLAGRARMQSQGGSMRKKILLVDDSKTSLLIAESLLRKGNYEVVIARDGEEALRAASRELPDLILMDVVMPKMDGLAACRALRELPSTHATPIILVTTRGEPFNVEAGYSSGCTDYVTKPVDGAELLEKVKVYLG